MRIAALLIFLVSAAQSQSVELSGLIGYSSFLDESPQHHLLTGGAARFYFTRRLAFQPELLYLYRSADDSDVVGLANIVVDLNRNPRVTPYFVGGVGVLRNITQRFSVNSSSYGAGVGVRIMLNGHWFIAPEFRVGTEPLTRVQAGIGYRWGRQ